MITIIEFTDSEINSGSYLSTMNNPEHGGENIFIGKVRNNNQNRVVVGVEYEIFVELAKNILAQLVREVRKVIDPQLDIAIVHRSGYLPVGEISVLIITSSRHRDEAFRACRFIIEEIKQRAPIWKQEYYIDGKSEWVQGHALCQHQ